MYQYSVLNQKTDNSEIFSHPVVWGVEVTNPTHAARCAFNIDPQHLGGNADLAAIEVALTCDLPPDGTMLTTNRADLDSIGAMAVIALRWEGWFGYYPEESYQDYVFTETQMSARITKVADSDKFAVGKGEWSPRALPSKAAPWPSHASTDGDSTLAAIASEISDFDIPLEKRIEAMERWLLTGETKTAYEEKVKKEREDMIAALESGEITYDDHEGIAVVNSTHRAGTSIAYSIAPIGIIINPKFRASDETLGRKITVCAWNTNYADLRPFWVEMCKLEPGWGGQPSVGGSPVPTEVSVDTILTTLRDLLRQ